MKVFPICKLRCSEAKQQQKHYTVPFSQLDPQQPRRICSLIASSSVSQCGSDAEPTTRFYLIHVLLPSQTDQDSISLHVPVNDNGCLVIDQ